MSAVLKDLRMKRTRATMSPQRLEEAADVLKAVAHPLRLRIIEQLACGAQNVSELCRNLGTRQAAMSQQLILLKAKGVLASRRKGNQVYYAIANPQVIDIIRCVCTCPPRGGASKRTTT